jgi:GAF domain-containing protein
VAFGKPAPQASELRKLRVALAREQTMRIAATGDAREARAQQAATAAILKVIARSPSDAKPVFDSIVRNAKRLLGAYSALVTCRVGETLDLAAMTGTTAAGDRVVSRMFPVPLSRGGFLWRVVLKKRPLYVADTEREPSRRRGLARLRGYRSYCVVPLILGNSAIGTLNVSRREPGAFSVHEIELLKTFADQAVIAVENARSFSETKEALERQTATAEILKVIARSPSAVQPVFDAIVASARRLLGGFAAAATRVEGGLIHLASLSTTGAAGDRSLRKMFPESVAKGASSSARALRTRAHFIVEDAERQRGLPAKYRRHARKRGFRSSIVVPLLRGREPIGTLAVSRREAGPFSKHQVDLLQTFADQAVIAIENVRLFNETKEALERQTATAEILKVIASSPSDVQPVFDAIMRSAARLFAPFNSAIYMLEDGRLVVRAVAVSNDPVVIDDGALARLFPMPLELSFALGKSITERRIIEILDTEAPAFPEEAREISRAFNARSSTFIPLLREGDAIGVIAMGGPAPGLKLSENQLALVKTFADQAVIAIENVRLFNETREALERQTATSKILEVIASSPSDVRPVLGEVAASCARLCDAADVVIHIREGDLLRYAAHHGQIQTSMQIGETKAISRAWAAGRAAVEGQPVHVHDVLAQEDEYREGAEMARLVGYRTVLVAPLMREGVALGTIAMRRTEVRPFAENQVELLNTFASQAVIAIENVRLFNETKESLERQTATAEILQVISGSPTNVKPVFDAIVKSAARLFDPCTANILMLDSDGIRPRATAGRDKGRFKASIAEVEKYYPLPNDPAHVPSARAMAERRIVEMLDLTAPDIADTALVKLARAAQWQSGIFVPLLREGEGIGTLVLTHPDPGYKLSDKQLSLLRTFADQAVIAIENVRLFKELQSRTEALTKSVGQLTALGEVGQAISSTLELETVLQTIVQRAVQLTGVDVGSIFEYDERTEEFELKAAENMPPALVEAARKVPVRRGDGTVGGTAVTMQPAQVPDIRDENYRSTRKELLIEAGFRSVLTVPLLHENRILGALSVTRKTPGPFAPEVVELMRTFATQSAMAIQNARLFREIAEKGRQLEEASRHKSQFLASMSHELRTPLNAILGLNEMVLGEVYGEVPADMQPPLAQVQTSGKHLLRLINNVLDLAKIEAGRMELALSDYSVQDVVGSVRSTLQPLAAEKGLEFAAVASNDIPLAFGDSGRITQCLMNLAGNSLKFTKAGKVEISAEEKDGLLTYRVADTGIGIPAEMIGNLFTEFKQTDATIASEYGGTGLGLSISKKFVEMHGGRIWVESEVGKGSAFLFEIPLRVNS